MIFYYELNIFAVLLNILNFVFKSLKIFFLKNGHLKNLYPHFWSFMQFNDNFYNLATKLTTNLVMYLATLY